MAAVACNPRGVHTEHGSVGSNSGAQAGSAFALRQQDNHEIVTRLVSVAEELHSQAHLDHILHNRAGTSTKSIVAPAFTTRQLEVIVPLTRVCRDSNGRSEFLGLIDTFNFLTAQGLNPYRIMKVKMTGTLDFLSAALRDSIRQLKPLYDSAHAFVRGDGKVAENGCVDNEEEESDESEAENDSKSAMKGSAAWILRHRPPLWSYSVAAQLLLHAVELVGILCGESRGIDIIKLTPGLLKVIRTVSKLPESACMVTAAAAHSLEAPMSVYEGSRNDATDAAAMLYRPKLLGQVLGLPVFRDSARPLDLDGGRVAQLDEWLRRSAENILKQVELVDQVVKQRGEHNGALEEAIGPMMEPNAAINKVVATQIQLGREAHAAALPETMQQAAKILGNFLGRLGAVKDSDTEGSQTAVARSSSTVGAVARRQAVQLAKDRKQKEAERFKKHKQIILNLAECDGGALDILTAIATGCSGSDFQFYQSGYSDLGVLQTLVAIVLHALAPYTVRSKAMDALAALYRHRPSLVMEVWMGMDVDGDGVIDEDEGGDNVARLLDALVKMLEDLAESIRSAYNPGEPTKSRARTPVRNGIRTV